MELNQNEYNGNMQTDMLQGGNLFTPTKKEKLKQKAKEAIKIITKVVGHQFKLTLLIASISLIVIILLCSAALYILDINNLDKILELIAI